jgi:hypothetical protein
MADAAADTASCGSYAIARHVRDGDHRHLCSARGSCSQSVDGGVRKLQLCNNPGTARRKRHARCRSYRPGYGRFWRGTAPRPRHLRPAQLLPQVVPVAQDRPGSPSATQRDTRRMGGSARHRRLPWQREKGGRGLCRARRREDAGGLCAEEPAGCLSLPSAGSHCLNGLPVHGSIAVAGRRGQANGGEPAVHISNKSERSAFAAASRSRRGGRHLIPSRVLIKGHTGTLRARAGYCPEVATPACRSHVRAAFRPARPVPACRQSARPTPLRGMPPRRLRQHCRDAPGCVRPLADGLWSSVRCTT